MSYFLVTSLCYSDILGMEPGKSLAVYTSLKKLLLILKRAHHGSCKLRFIYFLIEAKLLCNIVLLSATRQCASVVSIHVSSLS